MGKKKKHDDLTYEEQLELMNETSMIASVFLKDPDKDVVKENPIKRSIMDFQESNRRENKKKRKKKKKNSYSGLLQPRNANESAFDEYEDDGDIARLPKQIGKAVKTALKSTMDAPVDVEEEVTIHEDPNDEKYADMISKALWNGYSYQDDEPTIVPSRIMNTYADQEIEQEAVEESIEKEETNSSTRVPLLWYDTEKNVLELCNMKRICVNTFSLDSVDHDFLIDFLDYAVTAARKDLEMIRKEEELIEKLDEKPEEEDVYVPEEAPMELPVVEEETEPEEVEEMPTPEPVQVKVEAPPKEVKNDEDYKRLTDGHLTQKLQIPKELIQAVQENEKPKEESSGGSKYVFEQINP